MSKTTRPAERRRHPARSTQPRSPDPAIGVPGSVRPRRRQRTVTVDEHHAPVTVGVDDPVRDLDHLLELGQLDGDVGEVQEAVGVPRDVGGVGHLASRPAPAGPARPAGCPTRCRRPRPPARRPVPPAVHRTRRPTTRPARAPPRSRPVRGAAGSPRRRHRNTAGGTGSRSRASTTSRPTPSTSATWPGSSSATKWSTRTSRCLGRQGRQRCLELRQQDDPLLEVHDRRVHDAGTFEHHRAVGAAPRVQDGSVDPHVHVALAAHPLPRGPAADHALQDVGLGLRRRAPEQDQRPDQGRPAGDEVRREVGAVAHVTLLRSPAPRRTP